MRLKSLLVIFSTVFLCPAQIYSLSGIVVDSAGKGIDGATVRLGIAAISTTTGPDGKFSLTGGSAGVTYSGNSTLSKTDCRLIANDRMVSFRVTEKSDFMLNAYDVNGCMLASFAEHFLPGNHSMALPHFVRGMHVYQVTLNGERFSFKAISGLATTSMSVTAMKGINSSIPASIAATAEPIDDALLVTMDGYRLYRLPITNPDSSGIRITLLFSSTGTVTDVDGNVYRTMKIGTQEWTTENIRTTKYRDGTAIPFDTSSATWENAATPKYCYYGNTAEPDSIKTFGALYNWYVVNPENEKKIAPEGWHVPSDAEWDTLQSFLIANGYNWDGTVTDNKTAKAMASKTDWGMSLTKGTIGHDLPGNNSSGFSALPGGERNYNGEFCNIGSAGYWLGTTEIDESNAYSRDLSYDWGYIYRDYGNKSCGFSVRLVKDK